jgi:Tol biopolymer transport system component
MRRMTFALFAALLLIAARSPEERVVTDPASITSAANAAARPVPIDDLYFTRGVQAPAWSPDGSSVAFVTNLTGRFNLWRVASAGGWPIQLAVSDDRQASPAWSPDGKTILWQEDRGGNEYSDLYAAPANGGAAVNLTATPNLSETSAFYSPDGRLVAIELKSRTSAVGDVALFDPATKSVRNLTNEKAADRSWTLRAWTPDGKALIADRSNPDGTDSDIYRIDAATGAAENLTAHSKPVTFSAADISPDGKTLLITSNEKGGRNNIALLDLATKKRSWVTDLQWEATAADFSPDGKWLTYEVNENASCPCPRGSTPRRAARAPSARRVTGCSWRTRAPPSPPTSGPSTSPPAVPRSSPTPPSPASTPPPCRPRRSSITRASTGR